MTVEEDFRRAVARLEVQREPSPEFVPESVFRACVLLAESEDRSPCFYLGYGPILVSPSAQAWYRERLAMARMRAHFGMLS